MANKIQTVYVIHHSHTDIGYTDLQERILTNQAHYIHNALSLMAQPENGDFRWNCETLYCVEEFFKTAAPAEREAFLALARAGKIGLSANYLNYTDLCDREISTQRLKAWVNFLETQGIFLRTAMMADINGISMGYRDVMTENGVEFLYSNVHTHHGMYPLYQNQNAFFWEGKREASTGVEWRPLQSGKPLWH